MRADRDSRLQSLLTALLTLYGSVLAWRPLDEADSFFHLSLGRAVLQAGARTVPEPTAFVDFTTPAVASEWLWSVLSYGAFQLGGYTLLSGLGCALAGAACYSAMRLARASLDAVGHPWLYAGLCVLAVSAIACRLSTRPELTLLVLLPWYIEASRRYAAAHGRERLVRGIGLASVSVLWAQLHGSVVLGPLIWAIYAARPPAQLSRRERREDGATLALLLAAQLTSAYGVRISELVGSHAAGDAPRYIAEMAAPSWGMLNPLDNPTVGTYLLLVACGAAGALRERRVYARELLLMLLGAALFATANRFIAEASLCAVPWAASGAMALVRLGRQSELPATPARSAWPGLAARAALALGSAWLLFVNVALTQRVHGPIGQLGVSEHAFALHAPSVLAPLPEGAAVFTDYTSSAVVGFLAAPRLRTFVDGRTPLYFDATDFAVAREMERDGVALRNGLQRYAARAAVVRRESEACAQLSERWAVALVEPLFTTFVEPPAAAALHVVRPCGASYIKREDCESPGLREDLARVRGAGAQAFADFLEAEATVRCGGDVEPALRRLRAMEAAARPFERNFGRVLVEALLRGGELDEATARLEAAVSGQDPGMIALLQQPAAGALPLSAARRVLTAFVSRAGDEADVGVRGALAEICARAGDQECARFHATRAAVRGRYTSALDWVASHHDDERVRRDARRWLTVLGREAGATEPQSRADPVP